MIALKKEKVVSVSELLRKLAIPRPFMRKILQMLQKADVLRSYKGKGGGFSLAKPARRIYLLDLMRIFQGPLTLNECFLNKKTCPDIAKCPLRKKLDTIERRVFLELKGITVASLLHHKG
jgi:Rrf2 family protein